MVPLCRWCLCDGFASWENTTFVVNRYASRKQKKNPQIVAKSCYVSMSQQCSRGIITQKIKVRTILCMTRLAFLGFDVHMQICLRLVVLRHAILLLQIEGQITINFGRWLVFEPPKPQIHPKIMNHKTKGYLYTSLHITKGKIRKTKVDVQADMWFAPS